MEGAQSLSCSTQDLDKRSSQTAAGFSNATKSVATGWQDITASFGVPKSPYKRQISPQEWEALKPTIERLFIVEGKTYSDIAEYLRQNYNFNPTKRQFEGKTTRWGLRKNTRKADREIILSKLEEGDESLEGQHSTVKLTRQKLKRWEKEKEHVEQHENGTLQSEASAVALLLLSDERKIGRSIPCEGLQMKGLVSRGHERTKLPESRNPSMSSPEDLIAPDLAVHQSSNEEDTLKMSIPINECTTPDLHDAYDTLWDAARICESPRLTHLTDAIEIDKQLPLPLAEMTVPATNQEFLSIKDLQNLYKKPSGRESKNKSVVLVRAGTILEQNKDSEKEQYIDSFLKAWLKTITTAFSPLDEISPFPKSLKKSKRIIPLVQSSSPIPQQIVACRKQLWKLEKVTSRDNAGVIQATKRLAELCYEGGKHEEAEALFVRVATAKQRTLGAKHPDTITEYLNIIDARADGGDNFGAEKMLDKIYPEINKLFDPGCELSMRTLESLAIFASNRHDFVKADRLNRQMLQLALRTYGMRHTLTAQAMFGLAALVGAPAVWSPKDIGHHPGDKCAAANAKMLLQNCLDIESDIGTQESNKLIRLSYLSRIHTQAREYNEAIDLDRDIIRRSKNLHGGIHPIIQRNLRHLTKNFRFAGRLEESVAAASWLVRLSTGNPGWELKDRPHLRESTISSLSLLATTFEAMERWVEAATKYEDVYGHYGDVCEDGNYRGHQTEETSDCLRKCYTMQGLYTEPGAFEKRLRWILDTAVLKKFSDEKKSRKWGFMNHDEELDESDLPPRKKLRGESWIGGHWKPRSKIRPRTQKASNTGADQLRTREFYIHNGEMPGKSKEHSKVWK